MPRKSYNNSVFINYPVDERYRPLFRAAVFTVIRCGFDARCADEEADSSEARLRKIFRIISECRYGIHDLSRTQLDKKTKLPRFNMPFELGIFLGAKYFGRDEQDRKNCLIFEKKNHSYEIYISDIKGHDISSHHEQPKVMVRQIRDWLSINLKDTTLPGGSFLWNEYHRFCNWLPNKCRKIDIRNAELTSHDYINLIYSWTEKG
jgi:hypothetical protein